jgi:cellulose biosynthesis protein BcsQ
MIILATVNKKGGCGKTNLALNLTAVLATPRHKAALIGTDPQGSAVRTPAKLEHSVGH